MKLSAAGLWRNKKNILVVGGGQALASLGTLAGSRLLTESVSPDVFGEYKLALTLVSLASGFLIRPPIQFLMREFHDAELAGDRPEFLAQARRLFLRYSLLIVGVVAIAAPFALSNTKVTLAIIVTSTLVLVLGGLVELQRALQVTANQQSGATAVTIARSWLTPACIAGAVMIWGDDSATMMGATALVLWFIDRATSYISEQPVVPPHSAGEKLLFTPESWASLWKFCAPLLSIGVLGWLVHESDRLFLARYHDSSVVGLYSAAYGVVSAPFTVVVGALAQLLYPVMFRASATSDGQSERRVVGAMLVVTGTLCAVGMTAVYLGGDLIAWLALAEGYRQGAPELMVWIAAGYSLHALAIAFDLAAHGRRRTKDMLLAYGLAAATNLAFNYLLIPDYAAKGAVWATFAALLVYFTTMAGLFFLAKPQKLHVT